MSHESKCLTYTDLVARLGGAATVCSAGAVEEHLCRCAKCSAILKTMQDLFRDDATAEETAVLDKIEKRLSRASPSEIFRKINYGEAGGAVFTFVVRVD